MKRVLSVSNIFGVVSLFLLLFVLCSSFASASLNVTSPGNFTNFTGSVLINFSFVNASDFNFTILSNINMTFYASNNATNTIVRLGNSSACTSNVAGTFVSCAGTVPLTSALDGVWNITAQLVNGSGTLRNSSFNGSNIRFDSTVPQVAVANFSGIVSGSNRTGSLILNVSVIDLGIGIDTLFFNITNSTGGQNATFFATNINGWFNASLETTYFPDGLYNITVFVNDSLNNVNSTTQLLQIIFDNTAPSVSLSCDEATVTQGDTLTCSCSGSAASGINITSFTTHPSTSQTGSSLSTTCSVTSFVGLSASGLFAYVVQGATNTGSSGGGSGGGSAGTTVTTWSTVQTATLDQATQSSGVSASLGARQRLSVPVVTNTATGATESHSVGVVSLSTSAAVIEVASTPQQATLAIHQTQKFDVTADGYYDLAITLVGIAGGKANVTVQSIHEQIPVAAGVTAPVVDTPAEVAPSSRGSWFSSTSFWVVLVLIVIVAVVLVRRHR